MCLGLVLIAFLDFDVEIFKIIDLAIVAGLKKS